MKLISAIKKFYAPENEWSVWSKQSDKKGWTIIMIIFIVIVIAVSL